MIRSAFRIVVFLLVVLPFAICGGTALAIHLGDLSPAEKARRTAAALSQLREMGPAIEAFRRAQGRLPTDREVHCNWKPTCRPGFLEWHVSPKGDGTFLLTHTDFGIPFTPVGFQYITWDSRTGTTDYDGYEHAWRWQLWLVLKVLLDVVVIILPWTVIVIFTVLNRRVARRHELAKSARAGRTANDLLREFEGTQYPRDVIEAVFADVMELSGYPAARHDEFEALGVRPEDFDLTLKRRLKAMTGEMVDLGRFAQLAPLRSVEDYVYLLAAIAHSRRRQDIVSPV